jgi:hypothetical protein
MTPSPGSFVAVAGIGKLRSMRLSVLAVINRADRTSRIAGKRMENGRIRPISNHLLINPTCIAEKHS